MKHDPFAVRKQTGKQTAIVAAATLAGTLGNASKSVVVKYADTTYYQIGQNNDYVQEQGG